MKTVRIALYAASLAFAQPAFAQDSSVPPATDAGALSDDISDELAGDSVTVGIGAAYLPDYEGSDHYVFSAAPGAIGSVGGFNFVVAGNRASVDLIPNGGGSRWDIQAGPIGVINLSRATTSGIEDPRIKALGKVGYALELGGYVGIGKTGVVTSPYDKLSLSLSYRYDVTGKHDAGILQPSINYLTPLSRKTAVAMFVSAEHAERGYAETYFSITPQQSLASGLPTYNARSGWKNWTAGVIGTVSLTGDLLHGVKLVGGGVYRGMLNDFADSPVVSVAGSRSQWMGVLGVAYTF